MEGGVVWVVWLVTPLALSSPPSPPSPPVPMLAAVLVTVGEPERAVEPGEEEPGELWEDPPGEQESKHGDADDDPGEEIPYTSSTGCPSICPAVPPPVPTPVLTVFPVLPTPPHGAGAPTSRAARFRSAPLPPIAPLFGLRAAGAGVVGERQNRNTRLPAAGIVTVWLIGEKMTPVSFEVGGFSSPSPPPLPPPPPLVPPQPPPQPPPPHLPLPAPPAALICCSC